MKKTMILAAVAAMFMFSSCQKEELTPVQDSQSEELVFTATIDQSATKTTINTDGSDATNRGKIEWVAGDEITITDAESTSVVYVAETGGSTASFTKKAGETKSLAAGSSYSATYKAAPATVQTYTDYYSAFNQAKDLYMTAPSTSGTTLSFTAACGLLKLNLTASGDNARDISKIEIVGRLSGAAKDTLFALTCNNESIESAKDFYIALPAGSYDLMKFINSKGSVCFKKATVAMAIEANKIQPVTLSGITFSALLPDKFTVNVSGKQVQFTTANLWCNASASPVTYSFETSQILTFKTLGQTAYTADHVCHFFWTNLIDYQSGTASYMPYASSYSYSAQSTSDKFWCGEDNKFTIDGQSGLYALNGGDSGEWKYLFENRANASSLYKKNVDVMTIAGTVTNCVVIAPDNWDYTNSPLKDSYTVEEWARAESNGLVCLSAAGMRVGSSMYSAGTFGNYWSATSYNNSYSANAYAYRLCFTGSNILPACSGLRSEAGSVRLVYSEANSAPVYPEAPELACVKIGDVWWAPVNCGYDANHTYGSLYQWGRKYGQYCEDGKLSLTDMTKDDDTAANSGKFGQYDSVAGNWFSGTVDNTLWNGSSKGVSDPCPSGWRVPTNDELNALFGGNSSPSLTTVGSQWGAYFNGTSNPGNTGVFLHAAGFRIYKGDAGNRDCDGIYWSSSVNGNFAWLLRFYNGVALMDYYSRAFGFSVRCVKE